MFHAECWLSCIDGEWQAKSLLTSCAGENVTKCIMMSVVRAAVIVPGCRCAAVHRRRTETQAVGWHIQPEPISTHLCYHTGPILVGLARTEACRQMGQEPLLHQRLLPVAGQTHLPLGQTSHQTTRLVQCYKSSVKSYYMYSNLIAIFTSRWYIMNISDRLLNYDRFNAGRCFHRGWFKQDFTVLA